MSGFGSKRPSAAAPGFEVTASIPRGHGVLTMQRAEVPEPLHAWGRPSARGICAAVAREFNFDGLVGPSHNYAGVSLGNLASARHEGDVANPKAAALQGLAKMRLVRKLGVPQALLPPHPRPELSLARHLGFVGSDLEILEQIATSLPALLGACYAASSMWTANAATVCPSADAVDARVHFTPANLQNKIHRFIEAPTTRSILRSIFSDERYFCHHEPLPGTAALGDEGAANHSRFTKDYGSRGLQLFTYGESVANPAAPRPRRYPARQTLEACLGLLRRHMLSPEQVVLAQQDPESVDRGVFHSDVICVGDRDVFLVHERAFVDTPRVLDELRSKFSAITGGELKVVVVREEEIPVEVAVSTYLFNSQLLAAEAGTTVLLAPTECRDEPRVHELLMGWVGSDAPIDWVEYVDVGQSMHGGGGPACMRLRVVLTDDEAAAMAPGVIFTESLERRLEQWIERHYRDAIGPADLADPSLLLETKTALDELTELLGLGSIYGFQR